MMEKLVIFFYGIEAWSILGSEAIAALFAPYFASLLSRVLATVNPSALFPVQSLESRSVICRWRAHFLVDGYWSSLQN